MKQAGGNGETVMQSRRKIFRWTAAAGSYCTACMAYTAWTGNPLAIGQAWNMVLALVPLYFAAGTAHVSGKAARGLTAALWLLFVPNCFYLLTDAVHMPEGMEWPADAPGGMQYLHDAGSWALLLLFGTGAVLGALLGLESMRICRKSLMPAVPRAVKYTAGAGVLLLSGFGVYIGRFLRFNSWDVLHPFSLLGRILQELDLFSLQMTLLFAASIGILWLAYNAVCPAESEK